MQKFRQHNKIFAQACIPGQNAVKYTLTKKRRTPGRGLWAGSFRKDRPPGWHPAAAGRRAEMDLQAGSRHPAQGLPFRQKGKQNYDLSH